MDKRLRSWTSSLDPDSTALVPNKLVLVTAEGNPGKINSLDDLKTTEASSQSARRRPLRHPGTRKLKKHDITLKNATTEGRSPTLATGHHR